MAFSNVVCSVHEDVALVRLCRPDHASNALGVPFLRELHAAVEDVLGREELKVAVFQGTGRAFSTGADLEEIRDFDDERVRGFLKLGQGLLRSIMELNAVTVAAVNGLALGGGFELALACDIRWMNARGAFGLPEARLGLLPGWGGMELLRPLVPRDLYEQLVSGERFLRAQRAHEAGLVSRVFSPGDFEGEVLSEAKKIAAMGADDLEKIKSGARAVKTGADLGSADEKFLALWNRPGRAARLMKLEDDKT